MVRVWLLPPKAGIVVRSTVERSALFVSAQLVPAPVFEPTKKSTAGAGSAIRNRVAVSNNLDRKVLIS